MFPHFDFVVREERLADDECDRLISCARQYPAEAATVIDQGRYASRRLGTIHKVRRGADSQWAFDLLWDIAEIANRQHYGLTLDGIRKPLEYVEYSPAQGRFDWHNDYTFGACAVRKLTVIVQLSHRDDYAGGALQAFGADPVDMPAERGTVIVFPAILVHRVTQVTAGERCSLVAWAAGPALK